MIIPEHVAGLDIGFSKTRATSGKAILKNGLHMERRYGGDHACAPILEAAPFRVIAIDGPVVPDGQDMGVKRAVERVFCSGRFSLRCKPGMSHTKNTTGYQLRVEASLAADKLSGAAPVTGTAAFPLVRRGAIVEAFPNAFLGVCLDDDTYAIMPKFKRGKKFDWLYDQWVRLRRVKKLAGLNTAEQIWFQDQFDKTDDHELRAGIICVLTALLTARGQFTAVGDDTGGWFFLPAFQNWSGWAQRAVMENIGHINRSPECNVRVVRNETLGHLRFA